MIIGIDIDNTVIKSDNPFYIFLSKIFEKMPRIEIKKQYANLKPAKVQKSILNNLSILKWKNYYALSNAKEAINNLNEKHTIYFVTSRPNVKAIKYLTVKSFENFGIKYDMIFLACCNKFEFCKEKNIDIFVDNSPLQCKAIAQKTNTKAILFSEKANKKTMQKHSKNKQLAQDDNVLCLDNWNDIFEYTNYVYPILKAQKTPYSQEYLDNLKNSYKAYKAKNIWKNENLSKNQNDNNWVL